MGKFTLQGLAGALPTLGMRLRHPTEPTVVQVCYFSMMKRRKTGNPKRRIQSNSLGAEDIKRLEALAKRASYSGNPEHKRNPGDFGLNPPSLPRQGKTLCDDAGICSLAEALALLKTGFRRGLISVQERQGWPQNVWAVTNDGVAVEAMLENAKLGVYHGYPMQIDDPMVDEVLKRWSGA